MQKTIALAGKDIIISELPTRKNGAWRREFEQTFQPVAVLLDNIDQIKDIELTANALPSLLDILRPVLPVLLNAPEKLLDLLIQYAPQVESVADEVLDSELIPAFVEVLQLAYPFGAIKQLMTRFGTIIPNDLATAQSLPSLNGADGTTKSQTMS